MHEAISIQAYTGEAEKPRAYCNNVTRYLLFNNLKDETSWHLFLNNRKCPIVTAKCYKHNTK